MINSNAAVWEYFSFAWTPYKKVIMNLFEIFSIDFKIFFLSMNFGVVVPSQVSMRTRKFNSTFHLCGNFMRFSIHKCSLYFLHPWGCWMNLSERISNLYKMLGSLCTYQTFIVQSLKDVWKIYICCSKGIHKIFYKINQKSTKWVLNIFSENFSREPYIRTQICFFWYESSYA